MPCIGRPKDEEETDAGGELGLEPRSAGKALSKANSILPRVPLIFVASSLTVVSSVCMWSCFCLSLLNEALCSNMLSKLSCDCAAVTGAATLSVEVVEAAAVVSAG